MLFAKILLTVLLVGTAGVSVAVDWNDSHVFHPEWHEHARFHDVVLLVFLSAMVLLSLWLVWRKAAEPMVAVFVATAVVVCFWGSFFIAAAVPGSSPAANLDEQPATVAGVPLYVNMVIATVASLLAIVALVIATRSSRDVHLSRRPTS